MRIAIFDLDGTITRHDTLFPYVLKFSARHPWRLWRWLTMPWHVLRYFLHGRDRGKLKEALLVNLLGGVSRRAISHWNERFVARLVKHGMHRQALTQVAAHRAQGDYLILMSASPDLYVPAIARALGMNETICTGVRWNGMQLSGELITANRRDAEKLQCLSALRQRWPSATIVGYGNSDSDLAHLIACDHAYLVNAPPLAVRKASSGPVAVGWPAR